MVGQSTSMLAAATVCKVTLKNHERNQTELTERRNCAPGRLNAPDAFLERFWGDSVAILRRIRLDMEVHRIRGAKWRGLRTGVFSVCETAHKATQTALVFLLLELSQVVTLDVVFEVIVPDT